MSLAPQGMPCSGPLYLPAAISASARRGLGSPVIVEEGDDVVEQVVVAVQPCQIHLGQLERRHLPRLQQLRKVTHRPERGILEVRRSLDRRRLAERERNRGTTHGHAGCDRAEMKRRRHVVGNVNRAEFLIALEILVGGIHERFLLVFGHLDAGQLQRVRDHRDGDHVGSGVLHPRPHHARRERRAEAGAGERGHESSSVFVESGHCDMLLGSEVAALSGPRARPSERPAPHS